MTTLPAPCRVLLAAYDRWTEEAKPPASTTGVVLQALRRALAERGAACSEEIESVPALLRKRYPGFLAEKERASKQAFRLAPLDTKELLL